MTDRAEPVPARAPAHAHEGSQFDLLSQRRFAPFMAGQKSVRTLIHASVEL